MTSRQTLLELLGTLELLASGLAGWPSRRGEAWAEVTNERLTAKGRPRPWANRSPEPLRAASRAALATVVQAGALLERGDRT